MSPELEGVVVIAIFATVFDCDRQQSREVGCDSFLPKPVREVDLLDKLGFNLRVEWMYEEGIAIVDTTSSAQPASMAKSIIALQGRGWRLY